MPETNSDNRIVVTRKRSGYSEAGRRKRGRKRRNRILWVIVALVMIVVTLYVCASFFFKLKFVEVTGVSKYLPSELVESLELDYGDKLLAVNRNKIASALTENYSYIEKVSVKFKYPDTVRIFITQRKPAASYEREDGYVLIDKTGTVLEEFLPKMPYGVTKFIGMPERPVRPVAPDKSDKEAYQKYLEDKLKYEEDYAEYEEKLDIMRDVLAAIAKTGISNVTYADISESYDIKLLCCGRFTVSLGVRSQLEYKLTLVKRVINGEITDMRSYYINAKTPGTVSYRVWEN